MTSKSHDEIRDGLQGPCLSLPTIFTRDGEIDFDSVRNIIDVAIGGGGQIVMLTWGDSLISLLTDDELVDLHRVVIDHVGNRAVTLACDNMWGLPKAIEFGRFVKELGFDLCMLRPADWARGTPESLADFYRAVAREMRIMFVGDVPIRACELVEDEPNILAFKEDLGLDYAHEVLMRWGDRWPMVGGGPAQPHHLLWPHGARAWLDIFVRWRPDIAVSYWRAQEAGDPRAAWDIIMAYERPLWEFSKRARYGIAGVVAHALLEVAGVAPRWRRSPAPNPTDAELDELRECLRGIGLL